MKRKLHPGMIPTSELPYYCPHITNANPKPTPKLPEADVTPAVFFTSDTCFWWQSGLKKFNRPFDDVEEMNASLIARWNKKVAPDDIVFHLGQFIVSHMDTRSRLKDIVRQLNGEIYVIPTNSNCDDAELLMSAGLKVVIQTGSPHFIQPPLPPVFEGIYRRLLLYHSYDDHARGVHLGIPTSSHRHNFHLIDVLRQYWLLHGGQRYLQSDFPYSLNVSIDASPDLSPFSLPEICQRIHDTYKRRAEYDAQQKQKPKLKL